MKKLLKILATSALIAFLSISSAKAAPSVLTVPQGGTGNSSISGIVKGNGSSPYTTATPGTDYLTPTGSGTGLTGIPTLGGSNTYTGQNTFTQSAVVSPANIDTTLYADQFPGSDIGAKDNAAYAACPSIGCRIVEPAGTFSYTTPIVFGTNNKIVDLYCNSGGGASNNANGGTTLNYTPSTGDAITFNTNNYIVGGSGIDNCVIQGSNGTSARTTNGVTFGGTNGAFSVYLHGVTIAGFGTGVHYYQNTSFADIEWSQIHFNGRNLFEESTGGANGENMRVSNSVLADSNNQAGGATENFCINIQLSGNVQWQFDNDSFDDCQIYQNQSGGTANVIHLTNDHFENPNGQTYDYISTLSNQPADSITSTGNDYMNDVVGGMPEFVSTGGQFTSQGDTVDVNNNVTTPVTRFVTFLDSTNVDSISWSGLTNKFANTSAPSAITYIYGTVPYSPQGTGNPLTQGVSLDASQFAGSDMCAKVNTAYVAEAQSGQTGGIIIIPKGKFTCTTPINLATAGQRVLLEGTPAGGTEIDYNGSASTAAITINTGIQASGIDHTSGNGISGISIYCNATTTTNPKVGVFVGGSNGTDGAVLDATNIYGCGYGLQIGANAYHFLYENGTIRNNGMNVHINAASNSGESIDFLNAFIVDGASNNPADCFWMDNSAVASLNYTGGSLDDCQMHILQANNVTITGTHFEDPGSAVWGSYIYIILDQNLATNLDLNGDTFFSTGTNKPSVYIQNGGNISLIGDIVRDFISSTVTNFMSLGGSGRVTWSGFNNVSGTAITNVVSGSPYTPNGFATTAGATWSIDNNANALFVSLRGKPVVFASLPTTPVEGMMEPVTDSTTATWGATITGGGTNHVLAYYDNSAWTVAAK